MQARKFSIPMDEKALEDQWNQLVSSHFVDLEGDIKKMVTVNGDTTEKDFVRTDLLEELGWAISRKHFEDLLNGEADH